MNRAQGETQFTIVRNGIINRPKRKASSDHYCGFSKTKSYPYRVALTVTGELTGPDYFVVANEVIDDYVQAVFVRQPATESCEKMCQDICHCMFDLMDSYPQWRLDHIHVELTGTNGKALLSCDWRRKGE